MVFSYFIVAALFLFFPFQNSTLPILSQKIFGFIAFFYGIMRAMKWYRLWQERKMEKEEQ